MQEMMFNESSLGCPSPGCVCVCVCVCVCMCVCMCVCVCVCVCDKRQGFNVNSIHMMLRVMQFSAFIIHFYSSDDPLDVKEVLEKHRRNFLYTDESNMYRITVRRSSIWDDTLRAYDVASMRRSTFV